MIVDQCTALKPIWMVIPPEGITIPCPVHPKGHFLKGPSVSWSDDEECDCMDCQINGEAVH